MAYTMDEFIREAHQDLLQGLTPEERQAFLARLDPDDVYDETLRHGLPLLRGKALKTVTEAVAAGLAPELDEARRIAAEIAKAAGGQGSAAMVERPAPTQQASDEDVRRRGAAQRDPAPASGGRALLGGGGGARHHQTLATHPRARKGQAPLAAATGLARLPVCPIQRREAPWQSANAAPPWRPRRSRP